MMPAHAMQGMNTQQAPLTLQSMVYADENGVGKYQVQDSLPRVSATQQNLPHIHIPIIPSANQVIPRSGTDLGVYNTKNDILFPNKVLQVPTVPNRARQ